MKVYHINKILCRMCCLFLSLASSLTLIVSFSIAADQGKTQPTEITKEQRAQWEKDRLEMLRKGIDYLRMVQGENGSFSASPRSGIGPTIVVTIGLIDSGLPVTDPTVASALDFLSKAIQEDGGIYSPGGRIASYESCLALLCFHLANKAAGDNRFAKTIANAERFIRDQQYSEKNGTSKDDVYYGDLGYGNKTRPDLSNTQFFVETLHELGAGADDEAIQRALVFVSRCQNLESQHNTTAMAGKNPDGGFFYTCAGDGESPAGEVNGGLRSYGSITYAGLKSLIYAGVDANDPRMKAAAGWIRENYTTEENPGLGQRGLYYYYHTMSKALSALKSETFTDSDNRKHFWKGELIETLKTAQKDDGSWANENRMWMENDPNLVTGYVLIVLANCRIEK